jgi:hypothetical protein
MKLMTPWFSRHCWPSLHAMHPCICWAYSSHIAQQSNMTHQGNTTCAQMPLLLLLLLRHQLAHHRQPWVTPPQAGTAAGPPAAHHRR